ncbi:hypothetical protein C8Q76DRAFT_715649 [Earliella scabrosa]|nr:hypothetical protein C8Q76DRAFT_715649 [Earliella scabrosa]
MSALYMSLQTVPPAVVPGQSTPGSLGQPPLPPVTTFLGDVMAASINAEGIHYMHSTPLIRTCSTSFCRAVDCFATRRPGFRPLWSRLRWWYVRHLIKLPHCSSIARAQLCC